MPRPRRTVLVRELGYSETTASLEWYRRDVLVRQRSSDTREKDNHVRYYDAGMMHLAKLPLKGNDRTVLTALTALMEYGGPFRYSTAEIAEELGIIPQNVTRSIRALKDAGVLIELPHRRVLINPHYIWKGTAEHRRMWIEKLDKGDLSDVEDTQLPSK